MNIFEEWYWERMADIGMEDALQECIAWDARLDGCEDGVTLLE